MRTRFGQCEGAEDPPEGVARTDDRSAQVEDIVGNVGQSLLDGRSVDFEAVERDHYELMPELGQRLRDLRALVGVVQDEGHEASAKPASTSDAGSQADIEYLQQALDKYEVLEPVSQGGQGAVYRARQRGADRIVALKVLLAGPLASERQRFRFEREIQLVSRLKHPNIVTVHDSGVAGSYPFFVMEFIDGWSATEYADLNDLTSRQMIELIIKVSRAVHYAHQNGVIHRDLKPSNILVSEDGEPHVFDFGLAKDVWTMDADVTMTGQALGTLPYSSPEQAGGLDGQVDVRSDVYSLAVILFELLTGRLPYALEDGVATLRETIISAEPLRLRAVLAADDLLFGPEARFANRDLEAVLARALAKDKAERYQSADDLADDLEHCLTGEGVTARHSNTLYRLRKTLWRNRVGVAIISAILVAGGGWTVTVVASRAQIRAERDNARVVAEIAADQFLLALDDIDEAVSPLAGGHAVRDRLAQRAAAELPRLEALVQDDDLLRSVHLRLLERQGDLALERGEREAAAQHYQAILDDPQVAEIGTAAAVRVCRKLGQAFDDPTEHLQRAIEMGRSTPTEGIDDEQLRLETCRAHLDLARYRRVNRQRPQALEQYDCALSFCGAPAGQQSTDAAWQRCSVEALGGKGVVLHEMGRDQESQGAVAHAVTIEREIMARNPADTRTRVSLARMLRQLALLNCDVGDLAAAHQHLLEAQRHVDLLAVMEPESDRRTSARYAVYDLLVKVSVQVGELDQAGNQCNSCVAFVEDWAARDRSWKAQQSLALALTLRADVEIALEDFDAAREYLRRAHSVVERELRREPGAPSRLSLLVAVESHLAYCASRRKDIDAALAHRQRALELKQQIIESQPEGVKSRLDLATIQVNLAAAYMKRQEPGDAAYALGLLDAADAQLAALDKDGKLDHYAPRAVLLGSAIEDNRLILAKRAAEAPTPMDGSTSDDSREPGSSASRAPSTGSNVDR